MAVALVVSRGLSLMLPPELYTSSERANREAACLALHLSRRRSAHKIAVGDAVVLGADRMLHLITIPFDPPWRACPLWLGIKWKEGQSSPRVTPMAADADEARAWFEQAARGATPVAPTNDSWLETTLTRRGTRTYVAVHRLKRICGP
jgi:hypothetical protein